MNLGNLKLNEKEKEEKEKIDEGGGGGGGFGKINNLLVNKTEETIQTLSPKDG